MPSIDTHKVAALAKELEEAQKALQDAKKLHSTIKSIGASQTKVNISVNGTNFTITTMDKHYMQALKKGYDMVHLGLLKITSADVDNKYEAVRDLTAKLTQSVGGNQ